MGRIEQLVDQALDAMRAKEPILRMSPGRIHPDMLDGTIAPLDDWRGWKPIPSIITDADLDRLERDMGLALPASYKHFLKHKHFLRLRLPDIAIQLPHQPPDTELQELRDMVFNSWDPDLLIGRKYIYFADFHDYGLLCFDARNPAPQNEYPVVWIDHEDLEVALDYANDFHDLLGSDPERGNRFIERLNAMR